MSLPEERGPELPEEFAPARAEARRFAPDEMVACDGCRRANPPTRMNCLYCGAALPADASNDALRRPSLRKLEEWEQGFNVILLPREGGPESNQSSMDAASLLGMEADLFEEILRRGEPLPLARAASEVEAELIARRLADYGLRARTISDELLAVESEPPRRVRRLEMTEDGVRGRDASGAAEIFAWADMALIAVGRIVTRRVEQEERRGRVRSGAAVADSREVFSDEQALEIYAGGDVAGWRITAANFDYSCLERKMSLLAGENFKTLVGELRGRAPAAIFDDGYDRLRQLLSAAWPPAERTESGGLRRERPGKFNTESVTVVSNDAQFTRYARLRRLLAAHHTIRDER